MQIYVYFTYLLHLLYFSTYTPINSEALMIKRTCSSASLTPAFSDHITWAFAQKPATQHAQELKNNTTDEPNGYPDGPLAASITFPSMQVIAGN